MLLLKLIADKGQPHNTPAAPGGNPDPPKKSNVVKAAEAAVFAALAGTTISCTNVLGQEEEIYNAPPETTGYADQGLPYGSIEIKTAEGANNAFIVTVRNSRKQEDENTPEKDVTGLKILLNEFYKKYPNAESITFTFEDLGNFDFTRLIVSLLDKNTRDYEYLGDNSRPEYEQVMQGAIFAALYKMDLNSGGLNPVSAEPYAWNNPATYGIAVNTADKSVTLDLRKRAVLIHNLEHRDPLTQQSNVVIADVLDNAGERTVRFGLLSTEGLPKDQRWSYLGFNLEDLIDKNGVPMSVNGKVSFKLSGAAGAALPADFEYRVTAKNTDGQDLVFYPEEHLGFTELLWSDFHESFYQTAHAAAAQYQNDALTLNFANINSYVTVSDETPKLDPQAALAKINLFANYYNAAGGELSLQVEGTADFDVQKFLKDIRLTLNCEDSGGGAVYYSLDKQFAYSEEELKKLSGLAVYNDAGYWDIRIPLSCVNTEKGLPAGELTVTGVSFGVNKDSFTPAAEKSYDYAVRQIAIKAEANSEKHIFPFYSVGKTTPLKSIGIAMQCQNGDTVSGLQLSDFTLCSDGAEKPLPYLRQQSNLQSEGQAVSFVVHTGTHINEDTPDEYFVPYPEDKLPIKYKITASGDIINVY
ncbi:hypothetical protein NO1_0362 [Candidatus Termititenax aidoneus]|uniref:Uncharacterized protein n=1 Tax=Termititenax aidoneus TaxID=2218524 RepID=A0A388T9I8_TERA1|nr:hypothetical protein NO1_0362 [Candidatus Termititenax aidoneus]